MDHNIDGQVVEAMEAQLPAVSRYVRSLVRDPDEAADITQEACVRLLTTARADGLPDHPGAWMKRVAYNLVVSSSRRRQTAGKFANQLIERDAVPSLDDTILRRERNHQLATILASTRTPDRDALTMAASGHSTRDIATHLGRTEIATRTLICRARGRMRDAMVSADLA